MQDTAARARQVANRLRRVLEQGAPRSARLGLAGRLRRSVSEHTGARSGVTRPVFLFVRDRSFHHLDVDKRALVEQLVSRIQETANVAKRAAHDATTEAREGATPA